MKLYGWLIKWALLSGALLSELQLRLLFCHHVPAGFTHSVQLPCSDIQIHLSGRSELQPNLLCEEIVTKKEASHLASCSESWQQRMLSESWLPTPQVNKLHPPACTSLAEGTAHSMVPVRKIAKRLLKAVGDIEEVLSQMRHKAAANILWLTAWCCYKHCHCCLFFTVLLRWIQTFTGTECSDCFYHLLELKKMRQLIIELSSDTGFGLYFWLTCNNLRL